jgi:hypothetical protein
MVSRATASLFLALGLVVLIGCSGSSTTSKPVTGTGEGPKTKEDGKARGAAKDVLPLPGK